jgi:hypothetical protein
MLELIRTALESLTKLIPVSDLLKQRRADKVAEIGVTLFDLYGDVIRISKAGNNILDALSCAVQDHKYYYESGSPENAIYAVDELCLRLNEQSASIDKLIETFSSFTLLIDIAEANAESSTFLQLREMLDSKYIYIVACEDLLREARGLGVTWLLMEISGTDTISRNELIEELKKSNATVENPEAMMFIALCEKRMQIDTIPWLPKVNELAEFYVNSGLGRARLDDLVDCAARFRTAFQKVFKLEDVLLAAERRLKAKQ